MARSDDDVRQMILEQIAGTKSVAPRDIAQALVEGDEDWRKYLPRIRSESIKLWHENKLVFLRKKKVVSPEGLKGVFRLTNPDAAKS
ncbi:MAG: DUF3253 domain-containing protein [Alphaproteobacteria bacterium]|nr:DUF3253 domain-containing protein [Alphaproteobacteria bacterium]